LYQPRINIIKDENINLLAVPRNVLNRWKNYFNHVLNVHGPHVRQIFVHVAEPLVSEAGLVQLNCSKKGVKDYILRYTVVLVLYGIRRNCHSSGRSILLNQFIKRAIRLIVIIIEDSLSYQLPTKFYITLFWPG
jgi:hypothetical protein